MKKNKISQYLSANGLLIVLLLALIVRMVFFISLQPWNDEVVNNEIIVGDALEYHPLALSLLSNRSFEDFDSLRTPGYPFFVALLLGVSSFSVWFVLLVQILLSLFSVLLIYKIAAFFFNHKIALLAGFLFAIDTTQAIWTVELYTDTLFVFLFMFSIFYLCKGLKVKPLSSIILSALFLGIATLVRPISFLFPFVAIIIILFLYNLKLSTKLGYSFVFAFVFLITISPWLIHNYSKFGEAKLSSISGFNLLLYNAAFTEVYKTGKPIEEVRNDFNELAVKQGADSTNIHSFKNSQIYSGIANKYIRDNFFLYCKRHFMGIVNMYAGIGTQKITEKLHFKIESNNVGPFGGPGILTRIINFLQSKTRAVIFIALIVGLYLMINYIFSLYGIIIMLGNKERILLLFILIILYFSGLTGVVGYDRYRMPFMPFINMLCAVGLYNFYYRITEKTHLKKD